MPDHLTPDERSRNMAKVRGQNTKPELTVRRALFGAGYRYRLHVASLPGRPDLVLPRFKLAIFVHGCFWHGHAGCKRASLPGTRRQFWSAKIAANQERDAKALQSLESLGYKVLVLWECGLRDEKNILTTVNRLTGEKYQPHAKTDSTSPSARDSGPSAVSAFRD